MTIFYKEAEKIKEAKVDTRWAVSFEDGVCWFVLNDHRATEVEIPIDHVISILGN